MKPSTALAAISLMFLSCAAAAEPACQADPFGKTRCSDGTTYQTDALGTTRDNRGNVWRDDPRGVADIGDDSTGASGSAAGRAHGATALPDPVGASRADNSGPCRTDAYGLVHCN
ncbi:hypothetical protein [Alcanivorax sp. 1008]|uniref:hypothetical protein n=1 Tax=Alcanivorax sp. 1008 TaxID=2816853 RepID=UPI001D6AE5E4|nr:hypothetical protein [Alcanivorax sp. 1008]MCC1496821.1 hypothetical protein [Alcanivorax sp. 1008]